MIASTGLALAMILLLALGLSGWWTWRAQSDALRTALREQVHAVGALVAQGTEHHLGAGDLAGLRRLVAETARLHRLEHCQVRLPDGRVLADADPARIDLLEMPEQWRSVAASSAPAADPLTFKRTIAVPGRGAVRLEVAGDPGLAVAGGVPPQIGIGAIGAITMLLLLFVYRRMRRRFGAIGAIREALLALQAGEREEAALRISKDLGAEADAWNQMMTERVEARRENTRIDALEHLASGHRDAGGLEGACEAMRFGVLVLDEDARITYANGAATVLLQQQGAALTGTAVQSVIEDAELRNTITGALSSGTGRATCEMSPDGGTSTLRAEVRPLPGEGALRALVVLEDVSQQRVADSARNAFVAQATHELRAPLTNIRLYADTAMEDGEEDPVIRGKCLNVINQEARRLERIVSDMLSVSEIESGALQLTEGDIRLEALLHELEADYRAFATEKQLTLTFDLPPRLPVLRGDRDKITLVLHNVLGNALKYTPEGGSVTVRVESVDGEIAIAVADTGLGIDPAETERIFEKFQRADDPRIAGISGSGLGLALAREVARRHGGDVTVVSEPDRGSTFTVTLPMPAGVV